MASYKTLSRWLEGRRCVIKLSNGPELDFSAPPSLHGMEGVLTPEDAFVSSINTCYTMMFLWACEKFKIKLVSYGCEAEGFVKEFLDKTSVFEKVILRLKIKARDCDESGVQRAVNSALKYSLVAQSVKAKIAIETEIKITA